MTWLYMFIFFVVVHHISCIDKVKIGFPNFTINLYHKKYPDKCKQNLPYNNVWYLMSLIIAYYTNICIANQNHITTDHYECWLRTVHWLITLSGDWGPFIDWSLWVLIGDRSMTDYYECWLRTVQWLITMSAHWGPFNDWTLWVLYGDNNDYKLQQCLISNSMHWEHCRDLHLPYKYDKQLYHENFFGTHGKSEYEYEGPAHSVGTLPFYF